MEVPESEACSVYLLQASTQFFYLFTPFTLANFTAAFNINVTNINNTNVVPAGEDDAAGSGFSCLGLRSRSSCTYIVPFNQTAERFLAIDGVSIGQSLVG